MQRATLTPNSSSVRTKRRTSRSKTKSEQRKSIYTVIADNEIKRQTLQATAVTHVSCAHVAYVSTWFLDHQPRGRCRNDCPPCKTDDRRNQVDDFTSPLLLIPDAHATLEKVILEILLHAVNSARITRTSSWLLDHQPSGRCRNDCPPSWTDDHCNQDAYLSHSFNHPPQTRRSTSTQRKRRTYVDEIAS